MKFLHLLRVKQWSKNLLVVAAPFAAGHFLAHGKLAKTALAFAAFCAIASAGYIINDICDVEQDRKNPKKSQRPIAAGRVSIPVAWTICVFLALIGFGISAYLSTAFLVTITTYFFLTLAYSLYLKHEPVVELMIVSLGFALRAIGGATATNTPTSKWFLMVATFGPLVIVTNKRISEAVNIPFEDLRPVMKQYTPAFLRFVLTVAAAITMTSYGLWAFSLNEVHPYAEISLIPIAIQLFRYVWLAEQGLGEVPEDLIFKDAISIFCMLSTVVLLTLSVYAKG
jgi:decaprenyl-phosphate phosphoribosyltransferase